MLVVGDQEREAGEVAVRRHKEGDIGTLPVADFGARTHREIADRR
jgi:threonyl-tRNA synthetase